MKVLITDHIYPDLDFEREKLKEFGAELIEARGTGEDQLAEAVKDKDVVIVCYAPITERVIAAMNKCRGICRTGIGVNNVNIPAATAKGIKVTNVPDYCIEEVSDQAFALILALARKLTALNKEVKGGNWSFEGQRPIYRLRGKTLGLLGFGRIARLLAEKVKPYNFKLLAYDPYIDVEIMQKYGAVKTDLETIMREADYLSLHLPLTEETQEIINSKTLGWMKPTANIVNTSRGPLINEDDLCDALMNGKIAGAALDVLKVEKYDPANLLFKQENLILTPHSSFYSEESTQELREKVINDAVNILTGKRPVYLLNPEVV